MNVKSISVYHVLVFVSFYFFNKGRGLAPPPPLGLTWYDSFHYRSFAHDVIAVARNAAGRLKAGSDFSSNRKQKLNIPIFCVVYGCLNRSIGVNVSTSFLFLHVLLLGPRLMSVNKCIDTYS